jgi:hypothetical protein
MRQREKNYHIRHSKESKSPTDPGHCNLEEMRNRRKRETFTGKDISGKMQQKPSTSPVSLKPKSKGIYHPEPKGSKADKENKNKDGDDCTMYLEKLRCLEQIRMKKIRALEELA